MPHYLGINRNPVALYNRELSNKSLYARGIGGVALGTEIAPTEVATSAELSPKLGDISMNCCLPLAHLFDLQLQLEEVKLDRYSEFIV